jgi:hypothetical protein
MIDHSSQDFGNSEEIIMIACRTEQIRSSDGRFPICADIDPRVGSSGSGDLARLITNVKSIPSVDSAGKILDDFQEAGVLMRINLASFRNPSQFS